MITTVRKEHTWKKAGRIRAAAVLLFSALVLLIAAQSVSAHPEGPVHTIYWAAKLRKDVKTGAATLKKNSYVTVTERSYKRSGKSRVSWQGGSALIPNSLLSFRHDLTTIEAEGDYSAAVKERYANTCGASSRTGWFIWVSLDKQRVNIFSGAKGSWHLEAVFPCSSGKASTPTIAGWREVDFKRKYVRGLKWYTEICGSGFHKWPGKIKKSLFGKHTASHSCVRLSSGDAKWMYDHIPVRTRILVY